MCLCSQDLTIYVLEIILRFRSNNPAINQFNHKKIDKLITIMTKSRRGQLCQTEFVKHGKFMMANFRFVLFC